MAAAGALVQNVVSPGHVVVGQDPTLPLKGWLMSHEDTWSSRERGHAVAVEADCRKGSLHVLVHREEGGGAGLHHVRSWAVCSGQAAASGLLLNAAGVICDFLFSFYFLMTFFYYF